MQELSTINLMVGELALRIQDDRTVLCGIKCRVTRRHRPEVRMTSKGPGRRFQDYGRLGLVDHVQDAWRAEPARNAKQVLGLAVAAPFRFHRTTIPTFASVAKTCADASERSLLAKPRRCTLAINGVAWSSSTPNSSLSPVSVKALW